MGHHRQLRTSKNSFINIALDREDIRNHFNNSNNYADTIIEQINTQKIYDDIFKDKTNLVIIDVGANIGLFSLHVQDSARVIYAIEPTPEHFNKLEYLTKSYANIKCLNLALNDKNENINFYINATNSTMNSLVNIYDQQISVIGKTLSTVIEDLGLENVDLVKCDIEGSEMKALNDQTIGSLKNIVKSWFVEVHSTDFSKEWPSNLYDNRQILTDIFYKYGYAVKFYNHDAIYAYT